MKEKSRPVAKTSAARDHLGKKVVSAVELGPVVLPAPAFGRGKSVHAALQERRTVRSIGERKMSLQMLSNLLWAACGVNREKGPFGIPGITAASASNSQEIDVYVAMEEAVYRYAPQEHRLDPVIAGDHRELALGRRQGSTGAKAPVRLIYVVDIDKFSKAGFQEPGLKAPATQKAYYYVDTGLIAGNVYLFAAAQGLSAWFHNCDKAALARKLKLRKDQRVLFGQTIGYEEKP
jgi:nitroreductase